jgi:putative ABC transport system permease protein
MQALTYIKRNLLRNKVRTTLTILSVGFSLALMTVLHGYMAMQDQWGQDAEKYNRIVVMNAQGFSGELPIASVERIRSTPGIDAAVPYSWFGGNYKDEQAPFAQFGVDAKSVFDVWTEYHIEPAQLEEWQRTRSGCVVDRRLAEKRGWKIGERIPLKGTFYQFDLDLTLCGIFDTPKSVDSLWFHWEYLDEGLKQKNAPGSGNAGTIFAKVANADRIAEVSRAIDDRFASSDHPTRTQTEAAFAQMFSDMLGNVQAYIRNIGLAVVFSLSLVAANAMAMSMRERTTEIAVLKAIGFTRARVLSMVLGESCAITLLGGILGVMLGLTCLQIGHEISSQIVFFPVHEMLGIWLAYLLLVAVCIGLASGIVPATRAAQLSVVNGLRRLV